MSDPAEHEPRIQDTEQEWDEARGEDEAPGMTESPPESAPKEERPPD